MNKISEAIKNFLNRYNFKIEHANSWYKRNEHRIAEISNDELKILKEITNFSMSTPANHWAIIQSLKHIKENDIKGDIVECGVWRGGNLILFKKIIDKLNLEKKIFAFDTFEGMPEPGKEDFDLKNINAEKIYKNYKKKDLKWCFSNIDEVKSNVSKFFKNDYKNFNFIEGKVEETLMYEENLPQSISLLRLDTDFYDSIKKSLEVLYPRLVKGGVLIIDDYGQWKGARKAVDEYFKTKPFLFYVDHTCRLFINN